MRRGKWSRALARGLGRGLALGLLLAAAGCAARGTVQGKVLYKGQPVKGGTVSFIPDSPTAQPVDGKIEKDGSYSVAKVPTGPVKITVLVAAPPQTGGGRMPPGRGGVPANVMPPGVPNPYDTGNPDDYTKIDERDAVRFKDPDKSGLTYTVTAGTQDHDIDLK